MRADDCTQIRLQENEHHVPHGLRPGLGRSGNVDASNSHREAGEALDHGDAAPEIGLRGTKGWSGKHAGLIEEGIALAHETLHFNCHRRMVCLELGGAGSDPTHKPCQACCRVPKGGDGSI